jgi:IS30 family transposase
LPEFWVCGSFFSAAWECGLNENTNGLIRQYFPEYRTVVAKFNHRLGKTLGFQTPNQVCFGIHSFVARAS